MLDSKQVYQKSIEVLTKHIFDAKPYQQNESGTKWL